MTNPDDVKAEAVKATKGGRIIYSIQALVRNSTVRRDVARMFDLLGARKTGGDCCYRAALAQETEGFLALMGEKAARYESALREIESHSRSPFTRDIARKALEEGVSDER